MAVFSGPEIANNGLVLHLDAANKKSYPGSGTAWNDLSGNGNNGTLVNGPSYSNIIKYFTFDGVNEYALVPTSTSLSTLTSFTFSMILKFNSISGFQTFLHNKNGVWNGATGFYYEWRPATKSFMLIGSGSTNIIDSITIPSITTSTIQKIDVVVSGTTVTHYHNGMLLNSGNMASQITANANDLYLYAFYNNASFVNANIYTTMLYNRALTATEIKQNFEATRSRYGI